MGFYEPHYVVLKIKNHIVWFLGTRAPIDLAVLPAVALARALYTTL